MFNKDVILIVLLVIISAYGSDFRIILKDSSSVDSDSIRLYDVASVKAIASNSKKIPNDFLGYSAPAGYFRFLEPKSLIRKILSAEGISADIVGNNRIKVFSSCKVYKISDFREIILSEISSSLAWNREDFSISVLNEEKSIKCRKNPERIYIQKNRDKYAKGNLRSRLFIEGDGKVRSFPLLCRIDVETEVVVAKRDINAGEVLTSENLSLSRINVTRFGSKCFIVLDSLLSLKSTRTIKRGKPILASAVKVPKAVEKGDMVSCSVSMGNVRIKMLLRARESRNLGEKILVENVNSHKIMQAVVSGKSSVEIEKGRIL